MTKPILEVRDLTTSFNSRHGQAKAIDGVSLSLSRGKILGLVGESGSGKSVTGFSIMRLVDPPGRITGGQILFDGMDLATLSESRMRALRGRRISMVFQDPMMTLNPVLRIDTQMIEAILAHTPMSRAAARERACDVLRQVAIPNPEERMQAYPHQFSGGMRQRVAIAIALLNRPEVIIADEPTTALDVTVQGQILSEMQALVAQLGTALIWITHDLSVVSQLADDIAVMYAGKIVEYGTANEVINAPLHPYTQGLIDSVPSRNEPGRKLHQVPGSTPSIFSLPPGCAFRPRCSRADGACHDVPPLTNLSERAIRCVHPIGNL